MKKAVLAEIMALCRQDMGYCNWSDIPEKYWEMTERRLTEE